MKVLAALKQGGLNMVWGEKTTGAAGNIEDKIPFEGGAIADKRGAGRRFIHPGDAIGRHTLLAQPLYVKLAEIVVADAAEQHRATCAAKMAGAPLG